MTYICTDGQGVGYSDQYIPLYTLEVVARLTHLFRISFTPETSTEVMYAFGQGIFGCNLNWLQLRLPRAYAGFITARCGPTKRGTGSHEIPI